MLSARQGGDQGTPGMTHLHPSVLDVEGKLVQEDHAEAQEDSCQDTGGVEDVLSHKVRGVRHSQGHDSMNAGVGLMIGADLHEAVASSEKDRKCNARQRTFNHNKRPVNAKLILAVLWQHARLLNDNEQHVE